MLKLLFAPFSRSAGLAFCYCLLFASSYTLVLRSGLVFYHSPFHILDDLIFTLVLGTLIYSLLLLPEKLAQFCIYAAAIGLFFWLCALWWNFEFFRDYIHYASLGHAGDWREIARGIDGFQKRYLALISCLFLLALLAWFLKKINLLLTSPDHQRKNQFVYLLLSLAILAPTFLLMHKAYAYIQIEKWQMHSLPLSARNPFLQLYREKFISRNTIFTFTEQHQAALADIFPNKISATQAVSGQHSPFIKPVLDSTPSLQTEPFNVIVIVLESFRKLETLGYKGLEITPHYNAIARETFTPDYFYANSNQTIKAEIALNCGIHDFLIGTSLSAESEANALRCLPHFYQHSNYKTFWFHGAEASFYNRSTFLPKMGFTEIFDKVAIEQQFWQQEKLYKSRHWGIEDPYVFDYAFEMLSQQEKPFFAEILSVSNHHPFIHMDVKWAEHEFHPQLPYNNDDIYNRYLHLVHYTDRALGRFWQAFKNSPLYDNTIVVISGDHGVWVFPEEYKNNSEIEKYEAYTRLPLSIYIPGKRFSKPSATVLSQTDVPQLLYDILNFNQPSQFQSNLSQPQTTALLDPERQYIAEQQPATEQQINMPVFTSIGDNFYFREDGIICIPADYLEASCDDYLRRCVNERNRLQTNKSCYQTQGDLLTDTGSATPVDYDTQTIDTVVDYLRHAPLFH